MTQEKEKQNARLLLFADFSVPPEKALLFLKDMDDNPQKVTRYSQLLSQNLSKQYETIKEMSLEELRIMTKERAKDWASKIGPVTTQEYVTMSKQWDIPIDGIINKKITPELIKEMLDCFVIGQDKYKIKLSVAFYTYLMHGRQLGRSLPKSNLLVCGPSGSGKTYGMQILMCFDEFDKLFEKSKGGDDSGYYNARVINEMLNIIDDKGEVDFKESFDSRDGKRIKLPTRKMMFVFTGVFNGLRKENEKEDVEESGLPKARRRIGFFVEDEPEEEKPVVADNEPTFDDFIEFGIKPEILGRVQNFVFLDELSEDEMVALFDMGTCSPFSEFEQYFSSNGIDTILTEEGKHTLAKMASERGLGVRGMKSLLQQVLMEDMYDLDVGEDNILKVTKQYIIDNLNK